MKDGKFEVGDRVRVVKAEFEHIYVNGDVGKVDTLVGDLMGVLFDGPHGDTQMTLAQTFWVSPHEVELYLPCALPTDMTVTQTTEQPAKKPAKKSRVRAFKEDYITRAVTAEMRVHQLEVELNKAVDEAVDLRAANELASKELVRLTDALNGMRADFLTQKTIAEKYRQLYDGVTVWKAIRKAVKR